MNILFWGLTIGVIGKVLVVVGVLVAHSGILHEHRIDKLVLRRFRLEHTITLFGLLFILIGYLMEIYFYGFTPFRECSQACSAALINALAR
jgi:uncharacterized membrane protein YidH (DUF202 family)